jgi:hypothetical protein
MKLLHTEKPVFNFRERRNFNIYSVWQIRTTTDADVSTADIDVLLILLLEFTKYWSDEIKGNEMDGSCSTHRGGRGAYTNLVAKPERKRPLGKPRRKWDEI